MSTIRAMLEQAAAATSEGTKQAAAAPATPAAPAATAPATMTKEAAESLLLAAGLPAVKTAQLAGALQACAEMELTYKEASEYLNLPQSIIVAIQTATR